MYSTIYTAALFLSSPDAFQYLFQLLHVLVVQTALLSLCNNSEPFIGFFNETALNDCITRIPLSVSLTQLTFLECNASTTVRRGNLSCKNGAFPQYYHLSIHKSCSFDSHLREQLMECPVAGRDEDLQHSLFLSNSFSLLSCRLTSYFLVKHDPFTTTNLLPLMLESSPTKQM